MTDVDVYPLTWPEGLPRHKGVREIGRFKTTLAQALENARHSIEAFGRDSGLKASDIIFSSNYGSTGLGQINKRPTDPGVALWFSWDGAQRCIAVDRYATVEANLQAIHHVLEADRTKLRHGSLSIVRASYSGLKALPPSGPAWREVLGLSEHPTKEQVMTAYREKAKKAHPDVGGVGSDAAMAELNVARDKALKEIA